jgi:hypothetical protein
VAVEDASEYSELVAEFNAARDGEYAEAVERAAELLAELEMETAVGRASCAEVEESEADLERFDKWLGKIASRDYFHADGGQAARQAVERCRAAPACVQLSAVGGGAVRALFTLGAVGGNDVGCGAWRGGRVVDGGDRSHPGARDGNPAGCPAFQKLSYARSRSCFGSPRRTRQPGLGVNHRD